MDTRMDAPEIPGRLMRPMTPADFVRACDEGIEMLTRLRRLGESAQELVDSLARFASAGDFDFQPPAQDPVAPIAPKHSALSTQHSALGTGPAGNGAWEKVRHVAMQLTEPFTVHDVLQRLPEISHPSASSALIQLARRGLIEIKVRGAGKRPTIYLCRQTAEGRPDNGNGFRAGG